jgi:hypothetical protein
MMKLSIYTASISVLLLPAIASAQEAGTDPLQYSGPAWSPYVVGGLIGVLTMLTIYFSDKPLGASTAILTDINSLSDCSR